MPIADSHQIQTVLAYKTGDGQRFHDLEEARNHTRRSLLGFRYDKLCKEDPNFAKLDRDLFVEACYRSGTLIGEIMRDTLSPKSLPTHEGGAAPGQAAPRIIDNASPAIRQISEKLAGVPRTTGPVPPVKESPEMAALRDLAERDQQIHQTNTPRAGEPEGARDRMAKAEVDEKALEAELEASLNDLPTKD